MGISEEIEKGLVIVKLMGVVGCVVVVVSVVWGMS